MELKEALFRRWWHLVVGRLVAHMMAMLAHNFHVYKCGGVFVQVEVLSARRILHDDQHGRAFF